MSKGSRPRPFSVTQEEYDKRWDAIFQRDIPQEPKKGTCGCGRSPTGNCVGWHKLSEDEYKIALEKYMTNQETFSGDQV